MQLLTEAELDKIVATYDATERQRHRHLLAAMKIEFRSHRQQRDRQRLAQLKRMILATTEKPCTQGSRDNAG